jgi:26S proteasome regulatory subunit T5
MSTTPAQGPNPPPADNKANPDQPASTSDAPATTVEALMDTTPDQPPEETWDDIPDDVKNSSTEDILTRSRLIDNDIKVSFNYKLPLEFCLSIDHIGYAVRDIEAWS